MNDWKKDDAEHRRMVGRQLEIAMRALGKRAVELEREYGMQSSRSANWRAGLSYPPPLFLARLCQDTGLTMDFFYRDVTAGVAAALVEPLRRARVSLVEPEAVRKRGRPALNPTKSLTKDRAT
jgi:hypothetical protein